MAQVAAAALREVTKAYPGKLAACGVTTAFYAGEIHALIGENGAGKSTLVNILSGMIQPDSGTVEIDGNPVRLNSVRASLAEGIGVVHQSGSLIETLTVGENLRLARTLAPKPHSFRRIISTDFTLPHEISEQYFVYQLTPRQCQLLEIHRLLTQHAHILVLDEPTAALSPQESKLLFGELKMLARSGYAVVVVSHKPPELLNYCQRFTVLKDGRAVVSEKPRTVFSDKQILIHMGDEGDDQPAAPPPAAPAPVAAASSSVSSSANGAVNKKGAAGKRETGKLQKVGGRNIGKLQKAGSNALLSLRGVYTTQAAGEPLRGVDLSLRRGEILGLVGHGGSGAGGVVRVLLGEREGMTGSVEWSKEAEAQGDDRAVGFVPARAPHGVIASLTVNENLALRRRNLLGFARSIACRRERRAFFDTLIDDFNIIPPQGTALLRTLSGGNVRKVLLARELDYAKALLLAENPTAGLDRRAAAFVRRVLKRKAAGGACVVVHSDDLDELVKLCDRIAVFSCGRCVAELTGAEISSEAIGAALSGFAPPPVPAVGRKNRAKGGIAACAD